MNHVLTRDERFIEWLERRRDPKDLGIMAALRRGLGKRPGTAIEMYPYVVPFLSQKDSTWHEECMFIVASLFAMHNLPGGKGTMGSVLAKVAQLTGSGSVEARFVTLLDSTREELPDRLRHAVSLAKSKEVPVDWRQLLADLKRWNDYNPYVQRRWARDYWRTPVAGSEDREDENTESEEVAPNED